jgi:hypothetical protein
LSFKGLADIIKDEELLEAIKLMEESPLEHAWCRCGSRLPWKACHASPDEPGQEPHYYECDPDSTGQKRVCYRVSPLAPCPCKVSKKMHFDCCWLSAHPYYLDDSSGTIIRKYLEVGDTYTTSDRLRMLSNSTATRLPTEGKAEFLTLLRLNGMLCLQRYFGPKSHMPTWERRVFAGVVERIDPWFLWTDTHWAIEQPELELRVQEFNVALELYCDDQELVGAERDRVIRLPCILLVHWRHAGMILAANTKHVSRNIAAVQNAS